MPDRIAVRDFIVETREDLSSPTTSNFLAAMNACRNTVSSLEEVSLVFMASRLERKNGEALNSV